MPLVTYARPVTALEIAAGVNKSKRWPEVEQLLLFPQKT